MKLFRIVATTGLLLVTTTIPFHKSSPSIGVIGTGPVGLVTGTCLAELGYLVQCADCDASKIDTLNQGILPIYEPGLEELVKKQRGKKNLHFTTDVGTTIEKSSIIFIAVGTPLNEITQDVDMSAIEAVALTLSEHIHDYKIICMKSTVPIGTAAWLEQFLCQHGVARSDFDIISNPEFLREGSAIKDFFEADRIVIGVQSDRALIAIKNLYAPLLVHTPYVITNNITAETIKYASNSFLALKISFINDIATLCDVTGANIEDISLAVGLDKRINPLFLKPGPGFGGSCFPKDTQTLLKIAEKYNVPLPTVQAALQSNELRKQVSFKKVCQLFNNNVAGKVISILGLAFKANTDDIRSSASIDLIQNLINAQAHVQAYDPKAMKNMEKLFPTITYCKTMQEALNNADVVVIMTEWEEFKEILLQPATQRPSIIDMRNIINPSHSCKAVA